MAASLACRPLVFFTFGKKLFAQELEETVKLLREEGFTIGIFNFKIKFKKIEILRQALPVNH